MLNVNRKLSFIRISLIIASNFLRLIGYKPKIKSKIFVISHMRAGSTLLSNIILSGGNVFGVGETHTCYKHKHKINEAIMIISYLRKKINYFFHKIIFFDKILHNHLDKDFHASYLQNSKFIFLTRHPKDSMISLKKEFTLNKNKYYALPEDYLRERLLNIKEFWLKIPKEKKLMLSYEDLTTKTNDSIQILNNFLDNDIKVSKDYNLSLVPKIKGVGDYSENIKSGTIRPVMSQNSVNVSYPTEVDKAYEDLVTLDD